MPAPGSFCMPKSQRRTRADSRSAILTGVLIMLVLATGCDLFATRTPEPPGTETGAYLQPDTPDQVLENLRNAIAELNAPNYRRSFSDGFRFQPTAEAEAQNPSIWNGWSAQEEESYFRALVEAARLTSGNELRLTDIEQTAGSVRYTVDASYVLVLNHRSTELPNTLQGRVAWSIEKGQDGLWYIATWTDNSIGTAASWSDLKAAFIK